MVNLLGQPIRGARSTSLTTPSCPQRAQRDAMKILRSHTSAFSHQVHEAVIIQRNENNNILNSKGEYSRCRLPRLKVMLHNKELKEDTEMTEQEIEAEIRKLGWRKRSRKKTEKENKENEEKQEPPFKKKRRWKIKYAWKRKGGEVEQEIESHDHHKKKRRKLKKI